LTLFTQLVFNFPTPKLANPSYLADSAEDYNVHILHSDSSPQELTIFVAGEEFVTAPSPGTQVRLGLPFPSRLPEASAWIVPL